MRLLRPARVIFALSLGSLATAACGGEAPALSAQSPTPQTTAPTTTAAAVPQPITSLKRSQVKQTISKGLGYFLQNVAVEDYPVMDKGKFRGFKIRAINAEWLLDLRPGDVVTRVNGMPIEHPEEADAALRALEKAKALRVDFDRDGKAQTLELPITED